MRNMKRTLFGFLTVALMGAMLQVPVSAAEARADYDAMELQIDESMMAEANELSDFLTQYLAIEDDKLILTGGSDEAAYSEAQEVVHGLNESGSHFGYAIDGTVVVNPEAETTTGVDTFASVRRAGRVLLEVIISPAECRLLTRMFNAGASLAEITQFFGSRLNWTIQGVSVGLISVLARIIFTGAAWLFHDAGYSSGGLSIGVGLTPVPGVQWISVLW